jgi:hypothetical protein
MDPILKSAQRVVQPDPVFPFCKIKLKTDSIVHFCSISDTRGFNAE